MAVNGIPSWARVGAKVVFVGGNLSGRPSWRALGFKLDWEPTPKGIYTVRDTQDSASGAFIRVIEQKISGRWPDGRCFSDGWASVEGFRPLVTLEDDITTYFAELLDVREPVEA